ncbi:unnamed protein product [Calicophoron daubneyi]|uniref:Transmembrane protein family 132 fourth domain-containing protein n=1 Tax=Calicophoron daubneyi TaxID=300641 RepID=A0AAV2T8V3_CALDB
MFLLYPAIVFAEALLLHASANDLIDFSFHPTGSAFFSGQEFGEHGKETTFFTTSSNVDRYRVGIDLGNLHDEFTFTGNTKLDDNPLHISVHMFNEEVDEQSKTLHFICHAVVNAKEYLRYKQQRGSFSSVCCVLSANTSFSHELASCTINTESYHETLICHSQLRLPSALWKQKNASPVLLSYAVFPSQTTENKISEYRERCHVSTHEIFRPLPSVSVARSVPDAIREIGRSLLIQIPLRELKTNEEFVVPIRLKRGDEVSDFTLRCEIPANSFVEFVRIIWPGGLNTIRSGEAEFSPSQQASDSGSQRTRPDQGIQNVWDIFHRNINGPKRNVTEIVARFREDLARTVHTVKHSSATEVYKLLFRVNRPPPESPGRVAPRIFWSLVSLSRRNSPDRTVSGSPIVTRLNIESSELKHIAMVIKTSALVNLAVLTGQPVTYPVWVYGLRHDSQLIEVTDRATCHTGDDAVIHFANDACSRLGFSGAELDGSPGLPLVAKLDGRSATTTLLIWFPKPPAIKLSVGGSVLGSEPIVADSRILLKRIATEVANVHSNFAKSRDWPTNKPNQTEENPFYQYLRVRVLARFILAGSVLYDKDVLGGRIDQYVDVTDFTAHRLRLEYTHRDVNIPLSSFFTSAKSNASDLSNIPGAAKTPVRLMFIDRDDCQQYPSSTSALYESKSKFPGRSIAPSAKIEPYVRVWVVGQNPGHVHIRLSPIDPTLVRSSIPPGLAKQLKDQKSEHSVNNSTSEDDGSQWSSAVQEQPSLDVQVTDETCVWPIGLSAQLATDFVALLSQNVDPTDTSTGSEAHNSREFLASKNGPYPNDNQMPLYSGLYAIELELRGGRISHSGSINRNPGQKRQARISRPLLKQLTLSPFLFHNHSEYKNRSVASREDLAILVVWIHMSDGSTLLWNRMVEIYGSIQSMPFKLSIENLRPDLFRIEYPGENGGSSRNKRQANYADDSWQTWSSSKPGLGHAVHVVSPDNFQQDDEHPGRKPVASKWRGPTVHFLRDGISFSGDVLEVGLLSAKDEVLVPRARVYADIVTPKTTQGDSLTQNEFAYKDVDEPNQDASQKPGLNINNPYRGYKQEFGYEPPLPPGSPKDYSQSHSNHKPFQTSYREHSPIRSGTGDLSNGFVPLKDAPGFRSLRTSSGPPAQVKLSKGEESVSSHSKSVYPNALNEASLSDQTGEGKQAVLADGNGDTHDSTPDRDNSHGSRPALEMSMYILLGLFALVGLVFAVNCGAVVARYRWERIGRSRNRTQPDNSNALQTVSSAHRLTGSNNPGSDNELKETELQPLEEEDKPVSKDSPENVSNTKKYGKFLLPGRSKTKPLLHRDTNWVWIGGSKSSNAGQDPSSLTVSSPCSRSQNSPLLTSSGGALSGTAKDLRGSNAISRSQSCGNKRPGTVAVLSVGEADMLLMHSPYHEGSWQDTMGSNDQNYSPISPRCLRQSVAGASEQQTLEYSDPWSVYDGGRSDHMESRTFGRSARRHTTSGLTQRNYQGQECSIRIISNPMSRPTGDSHSHTDQMVRLPENTEPPSTNTPWQYDASNNICGSLSASVRRKQQNHEPVDWDSRCHKFISDDIPDSDWSHLQPRLRSSAHPPPKQPPPPIPVGHLNERNASNYGEWLMYRSWVRPRTGGARPPCEGGTSSGQKVKHNSTLCRGHPYTSSGGGVEHYPASPASPWQVRTPVRLPVALDPSFPRAIPQLPKEVVKIDAESQRVKKLSQLKEDNGKDAKLPDYTRQTSAPYPPVRTTSRTVNYHTIETHRTHRKQNLEINPRPLSLPQGLQATNELYSAANKSADSDSDLSRNPLDPYTRETEPLDLPCEASQLREPDPSPSEESLWWYHPLRRHRKRHPAGSSNPPDPIVEQTQSETLPEQFLQNAVGSRENLEYACPASCECDANDVLEQQHFVRTNGRRVGGQPPFGPPENKIQTDPTNPSTLTSASDLTWERELLSLSHDRLVAYFAGMKESNA